MFKGEEPIRPHIPTLSEQAQTSSYSASQLRKEIKALRYCAANTQSQLEDLNMKLTGLYKRIAIKLTQLAKLSD